MYIGMTTFRQSISRERYPASREAIRAGCICDPIHNEFGNGQRTAFGTLLFRSDDECPLHGFEAMFGIVNGPSRESCGSVTSWHHLS